MRELAPWGKSTHLCSSTQALPSQGCSRHLLPGCIFLAGYLVILSLGVLRTTPVHFSHSVPGAAQCPTAPALRPCCNVSVSFSVLWGSLCFLGSPHVLEEGQDYKIRSFCFPGRKQWKGPISPTVTLCL